MQLASKILQMFIFIFLHRFILFYTIYVTILKNDNRSPIIISAMIIIHEIGKFIADIYTGILADKYGIRRIMYIGILIKGIGICFWIISTKIFFCFFGMLLLGIGRSCTVGKIEAYVYNMLYSLKKADLFRNVWTTMILIDGLSAVLSNLLTGFIYRSYQNLHLVLIVSALIIIFVHIPFTAFIMSDPELPDNKKSLSLLKIIKFSLNEIIINKDVVLYLLGTAILPSLFIVFGKLQLFICNDIGMNVSEISNIIAITHMLQFFISAFFLTIFKKMFNKMTFLQNMFISLIVFIILFICNFYYGMTTIYGIVIFMTIYPILSTSVKYFFEKNLSTEIRATVSSFGSFLFSIFNTIFMLIIGVTGQYFSYKVSVFVVNILAFFFVFGIICCFLKKKRI